jgi:hypothetical protein
MLAQQGSLLSEFGATQDREAIPMVEVEIEDEVEAENQPINDLEQQCLYQRQEFNR